MGYSPQKKQLDLKEFLAQPAKKRTGGKGFSFRSSGPRTATAAREPAADPDAKKS